MKIIKKNKCRNYVKYVALFVVCRYYSSTCKKKKKPSNTSVGIFNFLMDRLCKNAAELGVRVHLREYKLRAWGAYVFERHKTKRYLLINARTLSREIYASAGATAARPPRQKGNVIVLLLLLLLLPVGVSAGQGNAITSVFTSTVFRDIKPQQRILFINQHPVT